MSFSSSGGRGKLPAYVVMMGSMLDFMVGPP
jgi:hypothetical protein